MRWPQIPTNRRGILWIAVGIAAFMLVVALAIPLLVPTDGIRAQIEHQVSQQTGRQLRIAGSLSFTVLPDLGLDARDVRLANVPGGHAADLVHVERMRIAVRLLPLFSGKIEAREIVLDQPHIALEVSHAGRANWTFDAAPAVRQGPGSGAKNIRFAGITIRNGSLSYTNDRLGIRRALDELDAKVGLTRLDAPASATGTLQFHGRKLDYSVSLTTVENLLSGKTTRANVALTSDFLNAGFYGIITRDGVVAGTGSLRTPSLKDVASWVGRPISAGKGLGALQAQAFVTAQDRTLVLDRIVAKLDSAKVSGHLTADLTHDVPLVQGRFDIDRLDLNPYLAAAAARPRLPRPIAAADNGWSTTPLKLDVLKLADGQIVLDVGALDVLHMKLGKTSVALNLAGGLATAHLSPMALYGGLGAADLSVDDRGPVPLFANKLVFRGIAMEPFLADTIGSDRIDGRGDFTLDVTGKGDTPAAVMRSLSGKGAVAIGPGHVQGIDMGRLARTITTILSAGAIGDSATTAFDRFTGSFDIANGVLSNSDLRLASAFINMSGRGRLDLGNRTIDYRIEPKASIGGKMHLLDVGVPFEISGPWRHVRYKPDLGAVLSGLVTGVLGKGAAPVAGLINGLSGDKDHAPNDKKRKHKSVGGVLKNMFGIH